MKHQRILLLIPVIAGFENYFQIPEGALRIKKYLEKKNIIVDVAAFKANEEKSSYPVQDWVWLLETGLAPENYWHKLLADYLMCLQEKIEKRKISKELLSLLKEFSEKKETNAREEVAERMLLSQYSLILISLLTEQLSTSPHLFSYILETLREKAPAAPFVAGGLGVWRFPFQVAGRYKELDFVVNKWGETPLEFLANTIEEYQIKHPITENELRQIFGVKVFEKKRPKELLCTIFGWGDLGCT